MKETAGIRLLQVNAFASKSYQGNPAIVCVLDVPLSEAWMQSVAAEMNVSASAFVHKTAEGGWALRWFSPTVEIDLCGHATMATMHALEATKVTFDTKSGILRARKFDEWIELDFPAIMTREVVVHPDGLLAALGFEAGDKKVKAVSKGKFDYLVEVESEFVVKTLSPNFSDLKCVPTRGVVVTAPGKDYDFVSRFFAPAIGIDEDPVCGSAHCMLAPYWSGKLKKRTGLRALQMSKRGGEIDLTLQGDRVLLKGKAITVRELQLVP